MTLRDTIHAWRERAAREREIALIPAEEIAGYGVSPEEFRALALMPSEQIRRMEAMARLNGVSRAALGSDRDLQVQVARECLHCAEQRRCRSALARGVPAGETGFCANHDTWVALGRPGALAAE